MPRGKFGHGTTKQDHGTVLQRARQVGIAGSVETLQLALTAMVAGYDRLLATTPKAIHPLIEGAFGKSVTLARQVLEAV